MKIVLTGAGGGHFYPLIAVAESLRKEAFAKELESPKLFFFSDQMYEEKALKENEITFVQTPAGKLRVYASSETIGDILKTVYGCFITFFKLFSIYPDAIFAKGGYASFPTLLAARLLSIPVIVHESDTVPGRTTLFAGKFAVRVALSYTEALSSYNQSIVAVTGQPIRRALLPPDGYEKNTFKRDRPLIFILGGSQGSSTLNRTVLQMLPEILKYYDIVHQTGENNIDDIRLVSKDMLKDHEYKDHYFVEGFVDSSLFYPKADLVITRAGSSMFEMALWQIPMIVVPIPESISRDQTKNAYAMASRGVALVVEEANVGHTIMMSEISRIMDNPEIYIKMSQAGKNFENSRHAADTIAQELIAIGLSHS
jgi:UDP-N-acetylglucosamine--N-acetylmuramyl-(pentapeptide) pyrophosphoryl-undecaprenol N-acetylglucosamine transferase